MNGNDQRFDYQAVIDRHYPAGSRRRDIYMRHCRSVADKAAAIARDRALPLEAADIEAAAMLHDIGIFLTDAPGIDCHGTLPYLAHGYAGADLLRQEGVPERYARVAERHTGSGLTPEEIAASGLPLPAGRSYLPETLLERLVCYADKFYSKSGDMEEKPLERVRASIARFGTEAAARFEKLRGEFD
ncbi:MAG: HD domain-containing protein [Muribaculaceae bacterium]|nr:HD domain-containing protein [Muribaculaceae bacterium]MDE7141913.1 HD domain-containing protein [Muribaculaceae bacterium]